MVFRRFYKAKGENKTKAITSEAGLVEHPYGTIKRQWRFDHIVTKKEIQKAGADVGLIMIAYNLRRLINIVGVETLYGMGNTAIILFS